MLTLAFAQQVLNALSLFGGAFVVATLVIHAAFAGGVARDAAHLVEREEGTVFVGPIIWVAATLVGGVFVLLAYWLIHHSALRR